MAHATDFFPGSKTDELANARDDLAAAFRIAARLGFHEGTCNHFSLLLPGSRETYLINPFGLSFEEIRPADLLLVDSAGSVIDGVGRVEKPRSTSIPEFIAPRLMPHAYFIRTCLMPRH
ncbi:class II Aldolase and Adducin N-terminal domain protein [Burkholderia cepacia]|nr:class II Aldolase and Adducin N-terminal domain protein [Burkholderia cepacia]